jgi:DNA polymerase (family 10)
MNLSFAQSCAAKLIDWLTPVCERIEVAGSIRRGCPKVSDVDLVIIPRIVPLRNLLGDQDGGVNDTAVAILERANQRKWKIREAGEQIIIVEAGGVQADFYFATRSTFASVWLCRTGSKEHNVWFCQRAISRGLHWRPPSGLMRGDEIIPAPTEEDLYRLVGSPYIEPRSREAGRLP